MTGFGKTLCYDVLHFVFEHVRFHSFLGSHSVAFVVTGCRGNHIMYCDVEHDPREWFKCKKVEFQGLNVCMRMQVVLGVLLGTPRF